MKTIRILALVGFLISGICPFAAYDHLMATKTEEMGHKAIRDMQHFAPVTINTVLVQESDAYWLREFADLESNRNAVARLSWTITSILATFLFLGILLKTKGDRT